MGGALGRQRRRQQLRLVEGGLTDLALAVTTHAQTLEDAVDLVEGRLDGGDGFVVEFRHRLHVTGRATTPSARSARAYHSIRPFAGLAPGNQEFTTSHPSRPSVVVERALRPPDEES